MAHPGAAWCQESDSAHGCSFPAASPCAPHLPGAPQVQTPTSPDDTPKLSRGPPPGLQVSLKALSCSRLPGGRGRGSEHSQPCWPPTAEVFPGGDDTREGRGSRRGMGQGQGLGVGWGPAHPELLLLPGASEQSPVQLQLCQPLRAWAMSHSLLLSPLPADPVMSWDPWGDGLGGP